MVVLLTTAFLALGLINLDRGPKWWRGQLVRLAVGVPLLLIYVYIEMPALVFPQALTLLLLTFIPNAVYGSLYAARSIIISRRIVSLRRPTLIPYLIGLAVLGALAAVFAIAPIAGASWLRDVPDVAFSKDLPPSAELSHVRVVPEESAKFAGDKIIGQDGAYYRVGVYNIQVEGGRLVWVAPAEFQGIVQWLSRRTSPGVVVVSAENPDQVAEYRKRAPMRYIPSALFNDNLYRHVYLRYGTEQILELTLQLDDRGDPQYLCTLGRPTIGWSGQKVTGVVIVDPATGAMRRVGRADFATLPRWVRRVYPPDLALTYNEWLGRYVHGWWNSWLVRRDVHVPARNEVFGLLADKETFMWFVDHTSPNRTDASMTGFTYMDTVSGKITYYTASGGEFNSKAAEYAVHSNPIVRQGRLLPTQPILYNVLGENTWVVPLVADTGKYQTLALVQSKNGHVVLGDASNSSPQIDAFNQYRGFLRGGAVPASTGGAISGTIDRVAVGASGTVIFTLRGRHQVYSAPSSNITLLARPGDQVSFRAAGGGDAGASLSVTDFSDAALVR